MDAGEKEMEADAHDSAPEVLAAPVAVAVPDDGVTDSESVVFRSEQRDEAIGV